MMNPTTTHRELDKDARRRVCSESLFGKVHTPLASRLSIMRIMATSMNVSLVCTFRS